jgi:hypothetical protein
MPMSQQVFVGYSNTLDRKVTARGGTAEILGRGWAGVIDGPTLAKTARMGDPGAI